MPSRYNIEATLAGIACEAGHLPNNYSYGGDIAPPEPDTEAPVAGTLGLAVNSSSQITVTISGHSDNVGIDHIVLERSPNGVDTWTTLSSDAGFPFASTGLDAATAYYYRATVYDAASNSSMTLVQTATTDAAGGVSFVATSFTRTGTLHNVSTLSELDTALATASAGDEIVLADGTYTAAHSGQHTSVGGTEFDGAFAFTNNGTAGNRIKIRAANPGQAHLTVAVVADRPISQRGPIFTVSQASHLIFEGLVFDAEPTAADKSSANCMAIWASNNIFIENCIFNGADTDRSFGDLTIWPTSEGPNDNHTCVFVRDLTEFRFANNEIGNHLYSYSTSDSHKGEGLMMYNTNNAIIEFNYAHDIGVADAGGTGLYLKGEYDGAEQDNYDVIFRYNHVLRAHGAGIMTTSNGVNTITPRTLIYQNLCRLCQTGIMTHGWSSYVDVFNNTLIDSGNTNINHEYVGGITFAQTDPVASHNNRYWGNLVFGVISAYTSWNRAISMWEPIADYSSDYNWIETGKRIKANNTDYASLTDAQTATYETNTIEGSDPFNNAAANDYTLHATNYTDGSFVPDTAGIYGAAVVPGCYIDGTEQIGRAA